MTYGFVILVNRRWSICLPAFEAYTVPYIVSNAFPSLCCNSLSNRDCGYTPRLCTHNAAAFTLTYTVRAQYASLPNTDSDSLPQEDPLRLAADLRKQEATCKAEKYGVFGVEDNSKSIAGTSPGCSTSTCSLTFHSAAARMLLPSHQSGNLCNLQP